ncbi:MAG: tRNA (adenosine(37)-N6)-threonylcarbamoyltransferase complex transferase subunit TsaD [Candidatus Omnitrophota bacterium]|nr:MAG: tRNA (adenosine(37)-N6)-threonylcarbamoyltransferase complex transferase subunit TsaD [Candidatus Omnitrophota bacterium]
MLVLGIETSCDETAVSLVENGRKILSNEVASSLHLHKKYGGVVPEIATRHHVELINYVLARALDKAKVKLSDIDLISVVYGPGLVGALLIGVSLAKALSLSLNVPLVGINHLQAHLYAGLMQNSLRFPFVGLVVSGGHTTLFYVKDFLKWKILGSTLDDAAGEAFDKAAKILNLGYPGGPIIEKKAKGGCRDRIKFSRAYLGKESLDFSFSGLKTALLYYVKDKTIKKTGREIADIAASFQEAAVDMLREKALRACLFKRVKSFVVGGGVIMNRRLREALEETLMSRGIAVHFPQSPLCQDNAAMVAGLGYQLYRRGIISNLNLEVQPNLKT